MKQGQDVSGAITCSVVAPFSQNRRRNLRAMGRDPKARQKKPTILTTVNEKCKLKIFFKYFLKCLILVSRVSGGE